MQVHAPIIEHRRIADDIFLLTLSVPEIAGSAEPGQFIHIKCGSSFDPLLRRPSASVRSTKKQKHQCYL